MQAFGFLVFKKNRCMHLLKSLYFLYIRNLLCFFLDNIQGLSFHFELYNVKDENKFYFEEFDIFIYFCLLYFCYHNHNFKYVYKFIVIGSA